MKESVYVGEIETFSNNLISISSNLILLNVPDGYEIFEKGITLLKLYKLIKIKSDKLRLSIDELIYYINNLTFDRHMSLLVLTLFLEKDEDISHLRDILNKLYFKE